MFSVPHIRVIVRTMADLYENTLNLRTKSSRVAFEALGSNDRKEFMELYRHEDDPETLPDPYKAVRLPDTDNTYMLGFSDQLRAMAEISDRGPLLFRRL